MVQKKVWGMRSNELCSQTVSAWISLTFDYRYFPPEQILAWAGAKDTALSGNDAVVYKMNNKMTSVLNWWIPRSPNAATDYDRFIKWLNNTLADAGSNQANAFPNNHQIVKPSHSELNDRRLERTSEQLRWGLIAPWANRHLPKTGTTLTADQQKILDDATVRVIFDTNGDGLITLPAALGGGEINKSVVAFVKDGPDGKWIKTW
jgi:hypothetical protein